MSQVCDRGISVGGWLTNKMRGLKFMNLTEVAMQDEKFIERVHFGSKNTLQMRNLINF